MDLLKKEKKRKSNKYLMRDPQKFQHVQKFFFELPTIFPLITYLKPSSTEKPRQTVPNWVRSVKIERNIEIDVYIYLVTGFKQGDTLSTTPLVSDTIVMGNLDDY